METKRISIKVRDIWDGYKDKDWDGVFGYNGKLNIRPIYQREFIYDIENSQAVIDSILKKRPINLMYRVKNKDGSFDLLDGQQRTLSICRFLDHKYYILDKNGNKQYEDTIFSNEKEQILNYDLEICICDGTEEEILDWFKTINIKGKELNEQEARNAAHTGPWLTDAKRHFSKINCAAYGLGKDYMNGSVERQDYLETVLDWISNGDVQGYMVRHRFDDNAEPLWQYYQNVINWIRTTFLEYRKEMKGLPWGKIYNKHKNDDINPVTIAKEVENLMKDIEIQKRSGIYEYILEKDNLREDERMKLLNLRMFDENIKRAMYERQERKCTICNREFPYEQMEGDHIIPWSQGGKTISDNCQMLCKKCNAIKQAQIY